MSLETGITYPGGRGRHRLHFKFLTGDCNWQVYGGKFVSKAMHNGDWHYWLFIDVCNIEDCGETSENKYMVTVGVVSPEAAEEELSTALESMGLDQEDTLKWFRDPLALVQVLAEYGTYAHLWGGQSGNIKKAMLAAKDYANSLGIMFGFAMDRPENGFGATGWDTIRGNLYGDYEEKFNKHREKRPVPEHVAAAIKRVLDPLKEKTEKLREAQGY